MEKDILTKNIDAAERTMIEEPETGEQSPAKVSKRKQMLKRAIMLIQEFQKLEPLLKEELDLLEGNKPTRQRQNRKQQRFEMYQRKYGF